VSRSSPSVADSIFADLPEALVEEMLSHYKRLGEQITHTLDDVQNQKEKIHATLKSRNLLKTDAVVIRSLMNPTSCAIDGSRAIERLMSTDIVAIAALAVEGLSPPTETRRWERPVHRCSIFTVNHHESTFIVAEAIMFAMELELAIKAPHDVILLDGSLETYLIKFNLATSKLPEVPTELASEFITRIGQALRDYKDILASQRSDKIYAGVPKYTSRKVISSMIGLPEYEDRSMLSMVLNSGEIVGPVNLLQPGEHVNFVAPNPTFKEIGDEILSLIREINVMYYRPSEYLPALRIEVASSIASNQNRLAILLEAVRLQCNAPGIMEPYPSYMADRMVKHLSKALPALRQATTQEIAAVTTHDLGMIFQAMHGYRTEHGR
jgi:hypothetical protein